ncbi:MAG: periplasmic heavy metal sensor [Bacteroidales bacterium]|nr:periplasmic heavy metal sensor [Bacteroidales bacterium]
MDYFTHKKILISVVIILIILNLGTLLTIWLLWKPGPVHLLHEPPPPPLPPPVSVQAVMSTELNLSPEQSLHFRKASERFMHRSESILRVYHRDKRRMLEELAMDHPNSVLLGHLTAELGKQQTELERVMVDYFLEIRHVCTPKQQAKFKGIIDLVLQRMSLAGKETEVQVPPPPPPPPE